MPKSLETILLRVYSTNLEGSDGYRDDRSLDDVYLAVATLYCTVLCTSRFSGFVYLTVLCTTWFPGYMYCTVLYYVLQGDMVQCTVQCTVTVLCAAGFPVSVYCTV
jgi:hypothetical protein